eukprot:5765321-Prymnesium_polylepis.1
MSWLYFSANCGGIGISVWGVFAVEPSLSALTNVNGEAGSCSAGAFSFRAANELPMSGSLWFHYCGPSTEAQP